MILSKGITLLEQTATFNNDIREWRQQPSELKTWAGFKIFFHCAHREQRHVVTTSGKGGYMAEVQNIYVMLTPAPPEEHNAEIESLCDITKGMQDQIFDMDELAQVNTVLTSTNTTGMAQLEQLKIAMGDIQAKIKTLISTTTKEKRRY